MQFMCVMLLMALAQPALAQIPGIPSPQTPSAPQQEQAADPFGRSTPKGTITGFTEAVERGDLVSAARYLQLTASQRTAGGTLARQLSALMDRYFHGTVSGLSSSPDGARNDGLPIDRERAGPLIVDDARVEVELVRVTEGQAGPIWLIASETVGQVPALHGSMKASWFERVMPAGLVRRFVFGVSLAQWMLLAASLVLPLVLLWLGSGVLMGVARRIVDDPRRRTILESWYTGVRWPAIAVLALTIHLSTMADIRVPLTFRIRYGRLGLVVLVIALAWLIRRLLTLFAERARGLILGSEYTGTRSLILLGERLIKALVVVVAIVAILTIVGVDTKTALAGVGIGGVAIALGGQKTVENFLGGVFLLSDRALAVGDTCTIANRFGVVEDITLRSVRLRTLEQTLLSIPAGILSQSAVENFTTRGKILAQATLHLRYSTSVEQLESVLSGIRQLVAENPRLETETSRVRLVAFGDRALEVEVFVYVRTSDFLQFLAVREELFLRIGRIVESSGSAFAEPTQFIYMDHKAAIDAEARAPAPRDDVRLAQSGRDAPAEAPAPTSR